MRATQYRQLAHALQERTTGLLLCRLRPADFSARCTALVLLSSLVLAAARQLSLAAVAAVRRSCPSRESLRQALYATLPGYDALRRRLPALLRASCRAAWPATRAGAATPWPSTCTASPTTSAAVPRRATSARGSGWPAPAMPTTTLPRRCCARDSTTSWPSPPTTPARAWPTSPVWPLVHVVILGCAGPPHRSAQRLAHRNP